MTPEQARIAAAFGNTREHLERHGRTPDQIEYNSDAARIAAAFGHALEGNDISVKTNRSQANTQTQGTSGRVVFGADRAIG